MRSFNIGNLNVRVPIVQGGMGVGVSLSGLAVAVANEGGVGVISSAGLGLLYRNLTADFELASILGLRKEISDARSKTGGIVGVNIMVAMSNFADMVRTSIQEKIDIIFSGAGLPFDLPSYLEKDSTTKLVPIVSSARAAKLICEKWWNNYHYLPDAIVVEGPKAGGHIGFKEEQIHDAAFQLDNLVREVCTEARRVEAAHPGTTIPVIAAGGIYTGQDIYDIMQQGAAGVQMGTRFVTSDECDAAIEFKQAYINSEEKDIEIIRSPVGMLGQAIVNPFIEKVRQGLKQPIHCPFKCIKTCEVSSSPYCIITALYNAFKGNLAGGYAFAGSNAFRATRIQSIREIFEELKNDFLKAPDKKRE